MLRHAGVEVVCVQAGSAIPRTRQRTRELLLRLDLHEVLAELARRDILSVILEAGATLNNAALAAGLVDKVRLFYAPILAGSSASRAELQRQRPSVNTLSDVRIEHFGPDFAIEGYPQKT